MFSKRDQRDETIYHRNAKDEWDITLFWLFWSLMPVSFLQINFKIIFNFLELKNQTSFRKALTLHFGKEHNKEDSNVTSIMLCITVWIIYFYSSSAAWQIWWLSMISQHQWIREVQVTSSSWTCAKHSTWSQVTSWSPSWKDTDLMMEHLVDKELDRCPISKSCDQWLSAQMETCDEGSALEPLLFNIFSGDMDSGIVALSPRLWITPICVVWHTGEKWQHPEGLGQA